MSRVTDEEKTLKTYTAGWNGKQRSQIPRQLEAANPKQLYEESE